MRRCDGVIDFIGLHGAEIKEEDDQAMIFKARVSGFGDARCGDGFGRFCRLRAESLPGFRG